VRIKIPGFAGATGGDTIASEATMPCVSGLPLIVVGVACDVGGVCDPDVVVVLVLVVGDLESASGVMVDWEEDREKVLARGARWVSLSSASCQPFHTLRVVSFNLDVGCTYSSSVSKTSWHISPACSCRFGMEYSKSLTACDGGLHSPVPSVKNRIPQRMPEAACIP
jgi:hypothetical protein